MLPAGIHECYINDYECTEFTSLVRENTQSASLLKQMTVLFKMLDLRWEADYSKFTMTPVLNSEGQPTNNEVETSFGIQLKMLEWIPATAIACAESGHVRPTLAVGSSLFLPIQDVVNLLTDHVSYLNLEVTSKSVFTLYVGVRATVDVTFIRNQLITWCKRSDDSSIVRTPTTFRTSLFHIAHVYTYLSENLPPKQIQVC